MNTALSMLLLLGVMIWLAAWFWFLTFQFSSGFFKYHLGTRLPVPTVSRWR